MGFAGSYLWRLRQKVGSQTVLHPGAMVVLEREDGAVLFTRCLSEAELHTITYPGGDVTHCFAVLFLARHWTGEPTPDGDETSEMLWAGPTAPPSPLEPPAVEALRLYNAYRESGSFQVA